MIELFAWYVVWAHQGGCCMFPLSSSEQEQSTLVHIWAHLSPDLQIRVIGLLAQLALNVVVARPPAESHGKASRHVDPATDTQNPC
jgi:hypothetical protein